MSIFSKIVMFSLVAIFLFGCKTKPRPIAAQTVTKGISPHPGWVDSKNSYKNNQNQSDKVSSYSKGGTLGDPSWANEVIPLEKRDNTTVIGGDDEIDNVLPLFILVLIKSLSPLLNAKKSIKRHNTLKKIQSIVFA